MSAEPVPPPNAAASVRRYAQVDPQGLLLAFYSSDVWPVQPAGCVQITDAQWQAWLANPHQALVAGQLVSLPPVAPTPSFVIASIDYLNRFTAAETDAIQQAALASPSTAQSRGLFNLMLRVSAAGTIDLESPQVQQGHALLVESGLLTAERSAAILAPVFPASVVG